MNEAQTESDGTDGSTSQSRGVSGSYEPTVNAQMDVIGWLTFLGVVVFLLPVLPFLVVGWTLDTLSTAVTGRNSRGER